MVVLRAAVISSLAATVAVLAGCGSKSDEPAASPPPAPSPPRDAAVDGITEIGEPDPERHLDDDDPSPTRTSPRARLRAATPIGVMMKSTPGGADAYVDGELVGITPHYWQGEADGREHTFTFILRGHAVAHYRFVPITSGVVHVTLERVSVAPTDAGLAPRIAPTFAPDAAVAPPPTVIAPPDAAPRYVPPPAIDAPPPVVPVAPGVPGDIDAGAVESPVPPTGPQP